MLRLGGLQNTLDLARGSRQVEVAQVVSFVAHSIRTVSSRAIITLEEKASPTPV